uniref:Uncharacterized protein n=1 Tax=Leersia perrieri TaxID=77586 RepID=A0A0D9WFA5_9ORYZ
MTRPFHLDNLHQFRHNLPNSMQQSSTQPPSCNFKLILGHLESRCKTRYLALRARRDLARNVHPRLHDLLALISMLPKICAASFAIPAPHASVIFEQGAYKFNISLSLGRSVKSWIFVAQVNDLDQEDFPCFNITTMEQSRHSTRSLLFSLLPLENSNLNLFPTIHCRYTTKAAVPLNPIAADVAPLSIAQSSALQPVTLQQTLALLHNQPIILPSPPIRSLSPPVLPLVLPTAQGGPDPSALNVIALPPFNEHLVSNSLEVWERKKAADAEAEAEYLAALAAPADPRTLQLLPIQIPDLEPMGVDEHPPALLPDLNEFDLNELPEQGSVRRSLRIRKAYNGERIDPVERASRRVEAAYSSNSSTSASCSNKMKPKKKIKKQKKLEDIMQLPTNAAPPPTSKKTLIELAEFCGLNRAQLMEEALKSTASKELFVGDHE